MVSRRVKLVKRLLRVLDGPAPLSTNKGPLVRDPRARGISRKDKKQSGWVTPRWPKNPGMKYQDAVKEALEPQDFYDEWKSVKDGHRYWYVDASHFKKGISDERYNKMIKEWQRASHINKKLTKELQIRRAIKSKHIVHSQNAFKPEEV